MNPGISAACWPAANLGACLAALVRECRLSDHPMVADATAPANDHAVFLERAADRAGCEVSVMNARLGDLEVSMAGAVPGIVRLGDSSYLAIVGRKRGRLVLMGRDSRKRAVPVAEIAEAVREPFARPHRSAVMEEVAGIGLSERAVEAMVRDRIAALPFRCCWMVRPASGAGLRVMLRQAAVVRNALSLLFAHLAQYLVWVAAWAVVGRMSISGRLDRGTLAGWALLLLTAAPFQLLATWLQGLVATGAGGLLKKRMLAGALKLRPDEVREFGIGSFLAQALEAETVEQLAFTGAISGMLSLLDLVVAGIILQAHAVFLAAWFAVVIFAASRFVRVYARWTAARLQMTELTTERMIGHRTRLTQQRPEDWHTEEDGALNRYLEVECELGRAFPLLLALVPRGWLIVGFASILPVMLSGGSTTHAAVLAGGVLLAYNALSNFGWEFTDIVAIAVRCRNLSPLFAAAKRADGGGALLETPSARATDHVVEADGLTFRYRAQGAPVLDHCSIVIRPNDRVLLEGPSGGGKTTLASVLAGLREPESGLLVSGGLDKPTLGASGWADRVVSVPQFHENHILTETLAFNLLLGREWPPCADDLRRADEVCRRLGLGELLDRMPNGLLQMVGEGGWQLSHGERTRIYMARALLQNSDLLILDESFGALDPENMQLCLEYTLERANALMVIAHP